MLEALTVKPDPQDQPAISGNSSTHLEADRLSNTNRAYQELRARILDGTMPDDRQYLEQELAEMLGMSRTPVREALIRLAEDRLVEVRPRHGARVLAVSADELSDIYDVVASLETTAVGRAVADGVGPAALALIEAACVEMEAASSAQDLERWIAADQAFHEQIILAGRNPRLTQIFQSLMAQVCRARRVTLTKRNPPLQSNSEHRAIVKALKDRDTAAARQAIMAHRTRTRDTIVKLLRAERR